MRFLALQSNIEGDHKVTQHHLVSESAMETMRFSVRVQAKH